MRPLDPDRGAPKVRTDPEWNRKAGTTIKQTVYKGFLDNPATVGDLIEETRRKDLFNMILSCVADGDALNTIEKVRDENNNLQCGYLAWKSLND